jgi:hypothetical protein
VWLGFRVVEVVPSPKLQDQAVGLPSDVSVNCTAWPIAGELGLKMNDAASPIATATVRLTLLEPELLVTVRVTVLDPAVVKMWLGFRVVEVVPSPKLQDQAVGLPSDVSVNCTACPAKGDAGLKMKEATSVDAFCNEQLFTKRKARRHILKIRR